MRFEQRRIFENFSKNLTFSEIPNESKRIEESKEVLLSKLDEANTTV
jgi:hypothetical protein